MADSGMGSETIKRLVGDQRIGIFGNTRNTNQEKIDKYFNKIDSRVFTQRRVDKTIEFRRRLASALTETHNTAVRDNEGTIQTSVRYRSEVTVWYDCVPAVFEFLWSQCFLLRKNKITEVNPSDVSCLWVLITIVGASKEGRDYVIQLIRTAAYGANSSRDIGIADQWKYHCSKCFNANERNGQLASLYWHFVEDCTTCWFCHSNDHNKCDCRIAFTKRIVWKRPPASTAIKHVKWLKFVWQNNIPSMAYWRHPYYNGGPQLNYSASLPNDYDKKGLPVQRLVVSMAYATCDGINGKRGTEIIIHGKGRRKVKIQMIYHAFVSDVINIFNAQSSQSSIKEMERGIDIETMRSEVIEKLRNRLVVVHNKAGIFDFCGLNDDILRENNICYVDLALTFQDNNRFNLDSAISCELLTILIQGREINQLISDNFPRPISLKNGEPLRPRHFNIDVESRSILKNFIAINNLRKRGLELRNQINIDYVRAWGAMELAARKKYEIKNGKFERVFDDRNLKNTKRFLIKPEIDVIEKYAKRHSNCKLESVLKIRKSLKFNDCQRCFEEAFSQFFSHKN